MQKKTSGHKVKQIMTTVPVTCNPDTTLDKVVELITLAEINAILVVDKKGTAKGVISLMDIINEYGNDLGTKTAKDIMHPRPDSKEQLYTIAAGEDVSVAAKEMHKNRIHRLIVLNPKKSKRAVGVVSASDIVRSMLTSEAISKK